MTDPRDIYQTKMIEGVYDAMRGGARDVMGVLPTGGGKSVVMSRIIAQLDQMGARQVVTAHRKELVSQMAMHVASRGIKHRIIAPRPVIASITNKQRKEFGRSFVNPDAACAIAGVDTLVSRADVLKPWAAQIDYNHNDEGHHGQKNNKWGKARSMFTNARGTWWTASPVRSDGGGLSRETDGFIDAMVLGPTMRELINMGALCEYDIALAESDLEMSDDDITDGGDFSPKKMRDKARKSRIVGNVVGEYCKLAFGKRAICFATDVETANKIANDFNALGIPAAAVSALTDNDVRDMYVQKFKDGKIWILVNVDLFGEGFDCLDVHTEILTPNGWKNVIDAHFEKQCYAWNSETNAVEIVDIENCAVRPTRPGEKMLTIESQHIDVRITEGHRVYFRKMNHTRENGMEYFTEVKTAEQIFNDRKSFAVPLAGEHDFPGINLTDDEIRILGWYLTDGWLQSNDTALCIAQSKTNGIEKIVEIINRLGWNYRTRIRVGGKTNYNNSKPCVEFTIPCGKSGRRKGWEHIRQYFTKDIHSELHKMTKEQFVVFWQALLDGDGSRQKGKSGTLTCARKTQCDAYMQMAVLRGFAVMHGVYHTKKGVKIYNLRVRDEKWLRMKPKDDRGAKFKMTTVSNEMVWCVTNRLGTLITRRNGKVVIIGNCPAASAVIMARPTASLGLYLQMFGRALRRDPNDLNKIGLIIDHVGNWKRHGFPDKFHAWTTARREKRAKQEVDPEDIPLMPCKGCSRPYERFRPCCPRCGWSPPLPEPSARTIDMVAGDLVLMGPDRCAAMRAAGELESPADLRARVTYAAGPIAGAGAYNRQVERIDAQDRLKAAMAQFGGIMFDKGRDQREAERRFYLASGVDVLTALAMDRADMEKLTAKIEGWYR